ncbi:response regulator transcription factor [Candidatus Gracilibacteria bacterium]|nr:response regulator transcription factor [Candidatus Gracilibacteria bacterium]
MNILLVEDNKTIANNIKKYLELDGNKITLAENGLYALEVFKHQIFDIVILDIMLPGMDGIQLCKKFKESQNDIPIIMTTAKGQIEDKLEGFNCGTDDYLVKPFDLTELDARIKAIMKRSPNKDFLEYKDIRLDKDQKKVFKKNKEIKFTIKEFMILELLLDNKGRSTSRTNIIEEIRGNEHIFEEDSKLDVYISNIRKKLGKSLIETIKGYGYQIG